MFLAINLQDLALAMVRARRGGGAMGRGRGRAPGILQPNRELQAGRGPAARRQAMGKDQYGNPVVHEMKSKLNDGPHPHSSESIGIQPC